MEIKLNTKFKNLNIYDKILWFNGAFLVILFGIFVYTPEYNGTQEDVHSEVLKKGLKDYLNQILTIELSVITTITIIIILISFIIYLFKIKSENLKSLNLELLHVKNENNRLTAHINEIAIMSTKRIEIDKIINLMKSFVLDYDDVISVQLYEYNRTKRRKNIEYEIRPTNYYYTRPYEVANLIHERYTIQEKLLIQYQNIKEAYKQGDYDRLERYILTLTNQLKIKENSKIISDDAINKYALLTLAMQMDFDELSFKIKNIDSEYQEKLWKAKRTGFLRGLINHDYCKFCHIGDSYKGQRVYITKCLLLDNKPHMFILVLSPEITKKMDQSDYINMVGENFYKGLSKELNIVYNDK